MTVCGQATNVIGFPAIRRGGPFGEEVAERGHIWSREVLGEIFKLRRK